MLYKISAFFVYLYSYISQICKRRSRKNHNGFITPDSNISYLEISKNMSLLSTQKKSTIIKDMRLEEPQENPLVVMLSWLMAKKKHTEKYADIWLQNGFDVLCVYVNPWELMWPVKGTQMVAAQILKFLDENKSYSPILLHGFSVGGYLWGEVLVQMSNDMNRYQHILDRMVGQVWDSVTDVTEVHIGIPTAVFPRNKVMANVLQQYILLHMKIFDKVATTHYVRSSQMFHKNMLKAPALLILSKTDPIGTENSNQRVRKNWESMGMKVDWKDFEKSAHVGHFKKYPKEYIAQLHRFLDSINLNKNMK